MTVIFLFLPFQAAWKAVEELVGKDAHPTARNDNNFFGGSKTHPTAIRHNRYFEQPKPKKDQEKMNQNLYKVIFNKSTGLMTAVAEVAHNNGKGSGADSSSVKSLNRRVGNLLPTQNYAAASVG